MIDYWYEVVNLAKELMADNWGEKHKEKTQGYGKTKAIAKQKWLNVKLKNTNTSNMIKLWNLQKVKIKNCNVSKPIQE